MICENCLLPADQCKCENGPLVECNLNIEAVQYGTVFTGEWYCECGAAGEFGTGTEHYIPVSQNIDYFYGAIDKKTN
jgi:hypothetical protein